MKSSTPHELTQRDDIPTGVAGIARRLALGPRLHPSVYVAPGATILGDVTIAEEASVWCGAVLRGDINRIEIGPRSNLQDRVVIHLADDLPVVIGELVTVGHGAILHACTVQDEVLVGMGAVVLDGAVIGARSVIGANALVTAGTQVAPGSLVLGSPGKIIRQLSREEQLRIRHWALKYVEVARIYRQHAPTSA